ncbi:MAG: hypothetical protein AB1458_04040 [Bacteroidota bacterium]
MKTGIKIALFTAAAAAFGSCVREEQFPIEPHITYKSFTNHGDGSATIVFSFTDGDGDIGIEEGETGSNFFLYYYYKDANNNFVPYDNPMTQVQDTLTRAYAVSPIYHVNPGKKKKSSKGEIQVLLNPPVFGAPETFKFACLLVDRAGRQSNLELTPVLYP